MSFAEALDSSNFPIIGEDFPRLFIPDRLDTEWGGGSETLSDFIYDGSEKFHVEGLQQTYTTRDTAWATASVTIKIYDVVSVTCDPSDVGTEWEYESCDLEVHAANLRDWEHERAATDKIAQNFGYVNVFGLPSECNGVHTNVNTFERVVVVCAIDNYYYLIIAENTHYALASMAADFANIIYEKLGESDASAPETQAAETQAAQTQAAQTQAAQTQAAQTQAAETTAESDGGCLIATAAYGSELTDEVQNLREIRNKMYETETGGELMKSVNEFYYSFSPTVSDWQRENPILRESVKLLITPAMISFTVLDHEGINSDQDLINYVASITFLNIGMYFVAPAILIMKIRKRI